MSSKLNLVHLDALAHPETPNELLLDFKPLVRLFRTKDKWKALRKEVKEQWEKDKHGLPEFGFK